MRYNWQFRPFHGIDREKLRSWSLKFNVSSELLKLLFLRGIDTEEKINIFLSPLIRYLPPVDEWVDLIDGAKLLASEITRRSSIAIWGDYDVDGVCSTAILYDFLTRCGCKVEVYIPNRISEGYGLNMYGVEELYQRGVKTLITVDCGITNTKEVKRAKELGLKVVITDHHYPQQILPEADILINPKLQKHCPYTNLAGVGVVFLLVALTNKLISGSVDIKNYLDLVALGTLADVVELSLENRILVKNGLLFLKEAKRPGIFALKEVANLSPDAEIGTYEVCFVLAPRINSAGRMEDARLALDLLLTEDLEHARKIANRLNSLNLKRQKEEEKTLKEALNLAIETDKEPAFVLFSPHWHEGVLGIVASRLAEKFYRPVILLTQNKSTIKGSGRSIPEFHLFNGLKECEELLEGFGGHAQAAGLSLSKTDLNSFKEKFLWIVKQCFKGNIVKPTILIDSKLDFGSLNMNFLKELELLQPHGPGNPKPVFSSPVLKVQKYKKIKTDHVALELRDRYAKKTFWGKFWKMADHLSEDIVGKDIVITFTPKLNSFNDLISIDLDVTDWKLYESCKDKS